MISFWMPLQEGRQHSSVLHSLDHTAGTWAAAAPQHSDVRDVDAPTWFHPYQSSSTEIAAASWRAVPSVRRGRGMQLLLCPLPQAVAPRPCAQLPSRQNCVQLPPGLNKSARPHKAGRPRMSDGCLRLRSCRATSSDGPSGTHSGSSRNNAACKSIINQYDGAYKRSNRDL